MRMKLNYKGKKVSTEGRPSFKRNVTLMGASYSVGIDGRVSTGHVDMMLPVSCRTVTLNLWVLTIRKHISNGLRNQDTAQ